MLTLPIFTIRPPLWGDCSFFAGWRHELEVRFSLHSRLLGSTTARITYLFRAVQRSTSSAGLPKRRAADTYPCDASWPGPSWQCMSLDRYTQSTLNVACHAKKSEVEGKIETQIEYQEVQEG